MSDKPSRCCCRLPQARCSSTPAVRRSERRQRHRRPRAGAGALGAGRSPSRHLADHPRRSRSHRRRGARCSTPFSRRDAVDGIRRARPMPAQRAATRGSSRRCEVRAAQRRGDAAGLGRCRGARPSPARARLGTPAGAQRRLGRARGALRRRRDAADRRHRRRSRARRSCRSSSGTDSHAEGGAPRQPDVDVTARCSTRGGRRSR